jgi:hypothetical protein
MAEPVPALPADAVDTGFRRAGVVSWRAADHSALFLVGQGGIRRVPEEPRYWSCIVGYR